jgi:uncharacterized protein YcbX
MAEGMSRPVGVVRALYRYPVKSMRGELLAESPVGWQGLPGDRRYAFVREGNLSEFPYLTAREAPDLLRYTPFFAEAGRNGKRALMVRTPEGAELAVGGEELRASVATRYSSPFSLLRLGLTGTFDIAPLSLLTTGTLDALGAALAMPLDALRFRPTIYLETPEGAPYPEDAWVGRTLIFGEDAADAVWMRVSERDARCKMITLDPETGLAEPRVLREVVATRDGCLGVYGVPLRLGTLRVGQAVRLLAE